MPRESDETPRFNDSEMRPGDCVSLLVDLYRGRGGPKEWKCEAGSQGYVVRVDAIELTIKVTFKKSASAEVKLWPDCEEKVYAHQVKRVAHQGRLGLYDKE